MDPRSATLPPGEDVPVIIGFKPYVAGPLSGLLGCSSEGASSPLGLAVTTTVETLDIEYGVKDLPLDPDTGDVVVDFGDEVPPTPKIAHSDI